MFVVCEVKIGKFFGKPQLREWIWYLERGRAWELRMLLLFLIWFHTFWHDNTRNENLRFFNLIRLDRKPQKWSNSSRLWTLSNVEWHAIKEDGSTCAIINWIHSRAKSSWSFMLHYVLEFLIQSLQEWTTSIWMEKKSWNYGNFTLCPVAVAEILNKSDYDSLRIFATLSSFVFFAALLWCLMSKLFMIVEWNDMRAERRSKPSTDDNW